MKTVLITGARAPIALELARSFKKQGHRVIMADTMLVPLARFSNAVATYYRMPSPRFASKDFVKFIQQIIEKEKITDIVPTCEEVFYFSIHQSHFDCKVWTSHISLMAQLHNKYSFATNFSTLLPLPPTQKVSEFTDWQNSAQYVFKPIYSRFGASVIKGEMPDKDRFSGEETRWVAQKYIQGHEICIYSIWDAGKLKAYSSYQPTIRVGTGAGIYFQPIEDKFIYKAVKEFGSTIQFTGQLSFDVIVDTSGQPFFIECNPRATSGGHLLNDRLALAFMEGTTVQFQDTLARHIGTVLLFNTPFQYFNKGLTKGKDIVFDRKDLKPFFLQTLGLAEFLQVKFSKKLSLLEASTYDIEWNGLTDTEHF